ncbi:MAG: hypothetical protein H0X30_08200 [Anaerolineae bacterium]|nr:hypothetical protein [Anaerolineae bacterium]
METTLVQIVQWLHILFGITWFGGYIFMTFGVWPVLLLHPAAEARAFYMDLAQPVGKLMMISGSLVLLLGILRGTVFGIISSTDMLFNTPYGQTWLAALVLTIILTTHGAISSKNTEDRVWEGDHLRPDATRYLRNNNIFALVIFGVVLACMVLMRFGM